MVGTTYPCQVHQGEPKRLGQRGVWAPETEEIPYQRPHPIPWEGSNLWSVRRPCFAHYEIGYVHHNQARTESTGADHSLIASETVRNDVKLRSSVRSESGCLWTYNRSSRLFYSLTFPCFIDFIDVSCAMNTHRAEEEFTKRPEDCFILSFPDGSRLRYWDCINRTWWFTTTIVRSRGRFTKWPHRETRYNKKLFRHNHSRKKKSSWKPIENGSNSVFKMSTRRTKIIPMLKENTSR